MLVFVHIEVGDRKGQIHNIQLQPNDTVLKLMQKVQDKTGYPPDQQRIIFAGKQLDETRQLSSYGVKNQAKISLLLRLRGDIGIFDQYASSPYKNILVDQKQAQEFKQVNELIQAMKGSNDARFYTFNVKVDNQKLHNIIDFANQRYNVKISENASKNETDDLKINITRDQLIRLFQQQQNSVKELQKLFGIYNSIVIRRCQAHNKLIDFHIDTSKRTLQMALNDDTQYKGGRLIYVSQNKLCIPNRPKGTVTIHDNRIVHGVTRLQSGIRYGLFFLQE